MRQEDSEMSQKLHLPRIGHDEWIPSGIWSVTPEMPPDPSSQTPARTVEPRPAGRGDIRGANFVCPPRVTAIVMALARRTIVVISWSSKHPREEERWPSTASACSVATD